MTMTIEQRLEKIEAQLAVLVERETVKDYYGVAEFAALAGRAEFTVRQWCRLGRIVALKKKSGRAGHSGWAISHFEWQRYQREGLLPVS